MKQNRQQNFKIFLLKYVLYNILTFKNFSDGITEFQKITDCLKTVKKLILLLTFKNGAYANISFNVIILFL